MNRVLAFGLALAVSVLASSARAETVNADTCAQASEDAQLFQVKGQLRAAREKFLFCGKPECPKVVRNDCSAHLDQVDHALPTIVIGAKDPSGKDLTSVRVSLDGKPLTSELDGKALAIDPGRHTLRFEADGVPALEQVIIAREGEKNRIVSVTLGKAQEKPLEASPQKPAPATKPKPPEARHGPSTATWIVGGFGAAALGTAGVVGLIALNKRSSLYDSCGRAGTCEQSDVDSVYRLYDVSYVAAGVGGALLVTSAVLYFSTSSSSPSEQREISIAPALGGVHVSGRF